MLELYFLVYRIPKIMTRLARERNLSALKWSLLGVGAWIGAEFLVMFLVGFCYGLGAILFGWDVEAPVGVTFLSYLVALVAAIIAVSIVRRILTSKRSENEVPLPPPPPEFLRT